MDGCEWDRVSKNAKSIVFKMLTYNPSKYYFRNYLVKTKDLPHLNYYKNHGLKIKRKRLKIKYLRQHFAICSNFKNRKLFNNLLLIT